MDRDQKLELIRRIFYAKQKEDAWFGVLTELCNEDSTILEIGSGSGTGNQNRLYPRARTIVGIDLDKRVLQNPNLDFAKNISAYAIDENLAEFQFDLIYSHMVAEHIDDAERFLASQLSLLKPGGKILHSTVSKYYWTSLINDFVPEKLKYWLIENLGAGRKQEDVFPVHYKLNSKNQIEKLCKDLDVNYQIFREDEAPGYLRRSIFLMLVYTLVHKPLQFLMPALRAKFFFIIEKK
jgi:2-polyprenyl-3-methyl-5-hydroxy-6-metoxy-1,4-benzoquinol methylase